MSQALCGHCILSSRAVIAALLSGQRGPSVIAVTVDVRAAGPAPLTGVGGNACDVTGR
jgi:hypothetical protein